MFRNFVKRFAARFPLFDRELFNRVAKLFGFAVAFALFAFIFFLVFKGNAHADVLRLALNNDAALLQGASLDSEQLELLGLLNASSLNESAVDLEDKATSVLELSTKELQEPALLDRPSALGLSLELLTTGGDGTLGLNLEQSSELLGLDNSLGLGLATPLTCEPLLLARNTALDLDGQVGLSLPAGLLLIEGLIRTPARLLSARVGLTKPRGLTDNDGIA